MKMPFSINVAKKPSRSVWKCNDRPEILDAMYKRFLGPGGDTMLPDEIKWLAITHKSFDQGRRGFNTRLAYYGTSIGEGGSAVRRLAMLTRRDYRPPNTCPRSHPKHSHHIHRVPPRSKKRRQVWARAV
jgi:large subunit ribosomal protein L15